MPGAEAGVLDPTNDWDALSSADQKRRFGLLKQELTTALNTQNPDPEVLRRRTNEMNDLRLALVQTQGDWWVDFFQYVEANPQAVSDVAIADRLFAQGRRAINANNLDELKSTCVQLARLLPGDESEVFRNYEGTTIRV